MLTYRWKGWQPAHRGFDRIIEMHSEDGMRAFKLDRADGIGSAHIADMPSPEPGPDDIRVDVLAAALNHRELWIAQGAYPGMTLPATLGCDGCGVIGAVGANVDPGRVGERVLLYPGLSWGDDPDLPRTDFGLLGMPGPGTVAESIVVPADRVAPSPAHLDPLTAAALPLAGLTAWRGLVTKGEIKAGDHVLLTGIGGGVASTALLLAVAMGARVFVTSGSDDTIEQAKALGAEGGVNYRQERWGKALQAMSGGIDLVFDGAPAGGYGEYGRSLRMGARVVVYGSTGGMSFPVNAPELFLKNVTVRGSNVGNPAEFADMVGFVAAHRITPVVDRVFPFAEAPAALEYLRDNHGFGKVAIDMVSP